MPPRIVARQLSHPQGFLGRIIRLLMNRTNAQLNAFALRQLQLQSTDRVLEIGFGGGATLPLLLAGSAFVAGIDRSLDAVESAKARFSALPERTEFRQGNVEAMPFPAASFDKAFTVNTVYFWTSLDVGFSEIHRVLKRGGTVVVGFLPKEWMDTMNFPTDIFTSRAPEDLLAALERTGFTGARIERPNSTTRWSVVVARTSANQRSNR
jgi:ubiquinone/menaquinone biosynthesis C-methylase UbiE